MNNEEKILSMLETLTSDMSAVKAEQQKTNDRLTTIEDSQARLEAGQVKLESDVEFVKASVVRIELDHGKKLDALFDGYKQANDNIIEIKEHVSDQDEMILKRVFPKALGK